MTQVTKINRFSSCSKPLLPKEMLDQCIAACCCRPPLKYESNSDLNNSLSIGFSLAAIIYWIVEIFTQQLGYMETTKY